MKFIPWSYPNSIDQTLSVEWCFISNQNVNLEDASKRVIMDSKFLQDSVHYQMLAADAMPLCATMSIVQHHHPTNFLH